MQKLKSALENVMPEILRNFGIKTDHSIPVRSRDLLLIKKKEERNMSSG